MLQTVKKWQRIIPFATIITLTTISGTSLQAQSIDLGVKAGINLNQMAQPGVSYGLSAGAFGKYTLVEWLDVQLEVGYAQLGGGRRGYTRDLSDIGGTVTVVQYHNRSIVFHNLDVLILAKLTLPDSRNENVIPHFLLGVAYSFSVAAYEHHDKHYFFSNGMDAYISRLTENVGSNYEQNQVAIIVGIGIDFPAADHTFSLDFRYRRGLNELNQIDFAIPELGGKLYQSTFSITAGLTLFQL